MNEVAVIGGSGFIGRHLVPMLQSASVRMLVHSLRPTPPVQPNVLSVEGDLLRAESLVPLMSAGCTVVNLAYLSRLGREANVVAAGNLAAVAAAAGVKRVIHLSTAAVVGRAQGDVVTEATPPQPSTEYERSKLAVEEALIERAKGAFELIIVRPTAVFGPGGKNLLKLASAVFEGNKLASYARSCFHGRRRMNLVCVENVVAAIQFLMRMPSASPVRLFIVSDDDDDRNNYRDTERMLFERMGRRYYPIAPIAVPDVLLAGLLRIKGRSSANPKRIYSAQTLAATGFSKASGFSSGIAAFAKWYVETRGRPAGTA